MSQLTFHNLLKKAAAKGASDLHLVSDKRPIYRIHGELHPDKEMEPIPDNELKQIIFEILIEKQRDTFLNTRELDFSYKTMSDFQFRVNVHMEKGKIAATVRITPSEIASREELGLPQVIDSLTTKRKGLVLLAGTAGSGKSTTLTYMIDKINREKKAKIITIEDPIEYVHPSKESLIIQREVGSDTDSFASALKFALRQDPDVVVVGEMRDPESISMALTTAETGHLVFTTVHASDAVETLNRIIDAYGPSERDQICTQLAGNLLAVIYQTLLPRKDGEGRVLATEIMLGSLPVRNLIRRKDFVEIRGQMEAEEEAGMHTLEKCLSQLYQKGLISKETAELYARMPNLLRLSKERQFGQMPEKEIIETKDKTDQQKNAPTNTSKEKINTGSKVLIIDSKHADRNTMTNALKEKGYSHIASVEKGKEGLDKAAAQQPDVIILDTFLQDWDSFELCKKIKQDMPNTRVIIVTSKLEANDSTNAQQAGADEFVIKTSDYALLCRAVGKHSKAGQSQHRSSLK